MPGVRIHYRLGENSKRMQAHAGARATEVLKAAGAVSVGPTLTSGVASGHIMGAARMGNDPERSVTNARGRCHDVKNLFIANSSLFVTSARVNPSSTLQALALYAADQIKQRLDSLFD